MTELGRSKGPRPLGLPASAARGCLPAASPAPVPLWRLPERPGSGDFLTDLQPPGHTFGHSPVTGLPTVWASRCPWNNGDGPPPSGDTGGGPPPSLGVLWLQEASSPLTPIQPEAVSSSWSRSREAGPSVY